jgi:hypothetical protein
VARTGPAHAAPPAPRPRPRPGRTAGRVLAGAVALAWIACPAVEPLPADDVAYPLWQVALDLTALATVVAAVALLWRLSRHAPRATIAAGVLMAWETITCPLAGHTPVGWWTWLQAALSLAVLLTGTLLVSRWPRMTAAGR